MFSAFTHTILEAKHAKNVSWSDLALKLGVSDVWLASCVYGENSMLAETADRFCGLLDLDESAKKFLTTRPIKGNSLEGRIVPTDPLMYRFYEILCVYGTSLKEVIQEKCGDGIMSAIDFTLEVEKIQDAKGDRIAVHMNGKFLPYRRF